MSEKNKNLLSAVSYNIFHLPFYSAKILPTHIWLAEKILTKNLLIS